MISNIPSALFAKQTKIAKEHANKEIKANLMVPKKNALTGPLASLKKVTSFLFSFVSHFLVLKQSLAG